jgi:hypothetical protein
MDPVHSAVDLLHAFSFRKVFRNPEKYPRPNIFAEKPLYFILFYFIYVLVHEISQK